MRRSFAKVRSQGRDHHNITFDMISQSQMPPDRKAHGTEHIPSGFNTTLLPQRSLTALRWCWHTRRSKPKGNNAASFASFNGCGDYRACRLFESGDIKGSPLPRSCTARTSASHELLALSESRSSIQTVLFARSGEIYKLAVKVGIHLDTRIKVGKSTTKCMKCIWMRCYGSEAGFEY